MKAHRKLRQENSYKFKCSLGCMVSSRTLCTTEWYPRLKQQGRIGNGTTLIMYFPCKHENLSSILRTHAKT